MSVTLAECISTRDRLAEFRIGVTLAVVAGLVWGVLLPVQIAAALV
jgi:thiamine transporter ThiT